MGPLPRTHGLLGAMLESPDVPAHARHHDATRASAAGGRARIRAMGSFLGVPIVSRGGIIGAFYLTDKEGADEFSDEDQHLIEMLAAHAALAIENARLYERSRELSDRSRSATGLPATCTTRSSRSCSASCWRRARRACCSSATRTRPASRSSRLRRARPGGGRGAALARLPAAAGRARDGRARPGAAQARRRAAARAPARDRARARRRRRACAPGPAAEVFRIAQEALSNALRHSGAAHIAVRLSEPNGTAAADGGGRRRRASNRSPPALRSRRLGLTSMEERADALGGRLSVESRPGAGATIGLEVPLGGDSRPDRG